MFCGKCGGEILNDSKFCTSCGAAIGHLKKSTNPPERLVSGSGATNESVGQGVKNTDFPLSASMVNSKGFDQLIGNNIEYYRSSFLRLVPLIKGDAASATLPLGKQLKGSFEMDRKLESAGGFNWAAAIFCWTWLAYRRMYLGATLMLVSELVVVLVFEYKPLIGLTVFLLGRLSMGFQANTAYYKHLNELLKKSTAVEYSSLGGVSQYGMVIFSLVGISSFIVALAVLELIL
jgi:hypothetical protein